MPDRKVKTGPEATFTKFLRERGLRCTTERMAILGAVIGKTHHFIADDIINELQQGECYVSRATVYNNLSLLVEAAVVRCHRFPGKPVQYECIPPQSGHVHLLCRQCGSVKEISDASVREMLPDYRYRGFVPSYYDIYVHGLCSKCNRKLKKSNQPTNKQ